MRRLLNYIMLIVALPALLTGCMSTKWHREKADKTAEKIISEYQQKALGKTESFTIDELPANSLRRQLMIAQKLPGHISGAVSNEFYKLDSPMKITLLEAMQIAARNSRSYQAEKEKVFSAALDLDLARSVYQNTYSGMISSMFSGSDNGDSESTTIKDESGFSRKLKTGGNLSSKIALDLVSLLTGDKTSTLGIIADASISIPLLKGFGKDIAMEPLTQAERSMVYTMWSFEQFKKQFAIDIANSYLRTLELEKKIQNSEANYKSIVLARERLEAMAKAGRTSQTQLDQATQDELTANNSLISSRQGLAAQMDTFNIILGIPVDAKIQLEASELIELSKTTMEKLSKEPKLTPEKAEKQAGEYILIALSNRFDVITVKRRYDDAKRSLKVAEDALDPDMKLQLSASTRQTSISGGETTVNENGSTTSPKDNEVKFGDSLSYSALLSLDLPWNKNAERAAFRKSIIALRAAERSIEEKEDIVKQELRGAARKILELKETYLIQKESVKLAERRVESTDLFLQAGQVQVRDLLEARRSLVSAQDQLVSAVVNYHIETLKLQKALELLEVDEKGLWQKQ